MKHNKTFIFVAGCFVLTGAAVYLGKTPARHIPRDLRDAPISSTALGQMGDATDRKPTDLPAPITAGPDQESLIPSDLLAKAAALNNGKEPASIEETLTLLYKAGYIEAADASAEKQEKGRKSLHKLNPKLLEFFTANYKPGAIVIVGALDPIGKIFRAGQSKVTVDGKPSHWGHCFVFGDLKPAPEGQGVTSDKSPYIYESDFHFSSKNHKIQLSNGVQESWIGKWSTEKIEYAAVIDLGLTEEQKGIVFFTALDRIAAHVHYSIRDNLGVLFAMIAGRQDQPNPFHGPHTAMFCSAFVRYCYEKAGRDFMGPEVTMFNTTPEDIAQMGIKTGKIVYYKP